MDVGGPSSFPKAMIVFRSVLLLRTLSGFMVLWQLGSELVFMVLMFVACVNPRRPQWISWSMLQPEVMLMSENHAAPRAILM